MSPVLRRWLPREHGLWAWAGIPLLVALLLAPPSAPGATLALLGYLLACRLRGRAPFPRHTALEVGGMLAFAGVGVLVAIGGGAEAGRTVAVQGAVAAWQVMGLHGVRRRLAVVLPGRSGDGGVVLCVAVAVASLGLGFVTGFPWIGAIPLLYPVRQALGRDPSSPRECARVGLGELGWTAVAAGVAVLA